MKPFRYLLCALAFILAAGATGFAADVKIEGTPVPPAPKPDFTAMKFLIGSWTCSNVSSRRPGPFTTTEVYSMDPTGYWLLRADTTQTASWIPTVGHGQTRYTFDSGTKRWVRISTSDNGGFSVATAPSIVNGKKTYTTVFRRTSPSVAAVGPEVFTKVSDTKKTMTSSLTEPGGRVVNVSQTCTKT